MMLTVLIKAIVKVVGGVTGGNGCIISRIID